MPEAAEATGRVTMNWPLELKEAVRERVGGRGLTPFVISAVEAKLGTHDEHQADSKELNEVKFLVQRLADAIALGGDYEDRESTIREIDLPPWVDTTGWPDYLARAINPEESTPEPVVPYIDTRDDITEQMDDLAEQEAIAVHEEMVAAEAKPEPTMAEDSRMATPFQGPGVGDNVLKEAPKVSHSNDLFKRLTDKAAEKGVDISGIDLKPASELQVERPEQEVRIEEVERPEVKKLTAEEVGWKLETVEEEEPTPGVHNHAWSRFEAEGYEGQPYFCACGATMDSKRVYPDGKPEVQVPTEVAVPLEVPAEEPTPIAASDVCPNCGSVLIGGECWECF